MRTIITSGSFCLGLRRAECEKETLRKMDIEITKYTEYVRQTTQNM